MEINEKELVELITKIVVKTLNTPETQVQKRNPVNEVVIGLAPAFLDTMTKTINGLPHEEVLKEILLGIEEEGMLCRVFKIYKTSDVCFIGKTAAEISGSGIGIGLQSKGTAVIHQRDLYPLSNLELFPQAPLMELSHYRQLGKNAAKYAKGEKTIPIAITNDPMVRPKFQVKAALMHIKETELVDKSKEPLQIKAFHFGERGVGA